MSMPAPTAPTGGTENNSTPPTQEAPTPTEPAQNQGETVDVEALKAENARLQKEAADARVKAKGAVADAAKRDQLLAFAAAIGIDLPKEQGETLESLQAKLQQEVEGRQTDQGALATERQVAALDIAALRAGVTDEKRAYLDFLVKGNPTFTQMDSASPEYKTSVAALVQTLVTADPYFKATPGGAEKSGNENLGGSGGSEGVTQEAFDKMGVMDKTRLFQTNPELFRRLQATSS